MDTATHFDTPLSGLDYLQYPPHSPFGVSMGCKNPLSFSHAFSPINLFFPVPPTSSPRSFSSLPLSWLQHRLSRPSLHAHDLPQCALQLSAGDLSSDSVGSNRNRRGCGSHSPGPSARQAAPEEAFPKGSDEFASDDDDDFNPAPSTCVVKRSAASRSRSSSAGGMSSMTVIVMAVSRTLSRCRTRSRARFLCWIRVSGSLRSCPIMTDRGILTATTHSLP